MEEEKDVKEKKNEKDYFSTGLIILSIIVFILIIIFAIFRFY